MMKAGQRLLKCVFLGDRQQMMRLDFETITPITAAEEEQLISWLERSLSNVDYKASSYPIMEKAYVHRHCCNMYSSWRTLIKYRPS